METWRKSFRDGFAPVLSTPGLIALARALLHDDPRLIQGATSNPPPLSCVADWDVCGACLVGYAGWQGDGVCSVGELERHFANTCAEIDSQLGHPGACGYLLNWYDDTPRERMRRELLPEVRRELARRANPPQTEPADNQLALVDDPFQ